MVRITKVNIAQLVGLLANITLLAVALGFIWRVRTYAKRNHTTTAEDVPINAHSATGVQLQHHKRLEKLN
jgi:hypothetical protein